MHTPQDLVDVRQGQGKPDRFTVPVFSNQQSIRVHDLPQVTGHGACLIGGHGVIAPIFRNGLVGKFDDRHHLCFQPVQVHRPDPHPVALCDPVGEGQEAFRECIAAIHIRQIGDHIHGLGQPKRLKICRIMRRVVGCQDHRWTVPTFNFQPPLLRSKAPRAAHADHTLASQPIPGPRQQSMRRVLVFNTLKGTKQTDGLSPMIHRQPVDES